MFQRCVSKTGYSGFSEQTYGLATVTHFAQHVRVAVVIVLRLATKIQYRLLMK
jgi:hypothetical protein